VRALHRFPSVRVSHRGHAQRAERSEVPR